MRTKSATPATIQTRSTSWARRSSAPAIPAVTAATRPETPTIVGSFSGSGAHATANAAAAANAGAATARCAACTPSGSTPRSAVPARTRTAASCSSPSMCAANQPDSTAAATATAHQTTENDPGAAVSSLRRRSDDRSPRLPSATGDPAATSTAPLVRPRSVNGSPGSEAGPAAGVQRRHEREPALRGVLPRDVLRGRARRHEEVDDPGLAVHGDGERARGSDGASLTDDHGASRVGRGGC